MQTSTPNNLQSDKVIQSGVYNWGLVNRFDGKPVMPFLLSLALCAVATGQSFEVAVIRPHAPDGGTILPQIGGQLNASLTLKYMIQEAYNVAPYQISGGPAWVEKELWDITAKAEGIAGEIPLEQLRPMLKELIQDRFRLTLRPEKKVLPYFALVVARTGAKLKPNTGEPFDFRLGRGPIANFTKVTMPGFASWLGPWVQADRLVVDKTGLTGEYNFRLQWTPTPMRGGPPGEADGATQAGSAIGPSIFTALQEQLGLRLESQRGPIDTSWWKAPNGHPRTDRRRQRPFE